VSDTEEYWDDLIVEAIRQATTPSLFTDTKPAYRELFEKGDYTSMSLKAFEEWGVAEEPGQRYLQHLLVSKQRDYGPSNILNGPFPPQVGLQVRLWDKVARYENLTRPGADAPRNETLKDTLLDIIGYVCIKWMVDCNVMDLLVNPEGTK